MPDFEREEHLIDDTTTVILDRLPLSDGSFSYFLNIQEDGQRIPLQMVDEDAARQAFNALKEGAA